MSKKTKSAPREWHARHALWRWELSLHECSTPSLGMGAAAEEQSEICVICSGSSQEADPGRPGKRLNIRISGCDYCKGYWHLRERVVRNWKERYCLLCWRCSFFEIAAACYSVCPAGRLLIAGACFMRLKTSSVGYILICSRSF